MSEFNPHSLEPFWDTWYIDSLIGEGSFGSVYKIYREEFGTRYYSALKIISIPRTVTEEKQVFYDGMDEKSATEYFREIVEVIYKEIAIMAELKGKTNIVSYEDHKIIPKQNGIGFHILIRMELLESLNDYILNHPFRAADVVNMGKDLCKALMLCQKRHLIHRDIKPANIFVSSDGDYKLGDFGIARQMEGAQDGLSIKGTYSYMAPEVYLGNIYDERVDIYSLGMVLYYYLNDKKAPFSDTSGKVQKYSDRQESLRKRFSGEKLPAPVKAGERLAEVILKACEFDPKNRYQSPEEFLAALEGLQQSDLSGLDLGKEEPEENKEPESLEETIAISMSEDADRTEISSMEEELTQALPLTAPVEETVMEDEATVMLSQDDDVTVHMENPEAFLSMNQNTAPKKGSNTKIISIAAAALLLILAGTAFYLIRSKSTEEDAAPVENEVYEVEEAEEEGESSSDNSLVREEKAVPEETEDEPTPAVEEVITEYEKYALELENRELEDCSAIENIELLTSLNISYNRLSSLDELKNSIGLEYLNVRDNNIKDLEVLRGMVRLTAFDATNNQISDISPLAGLSSLNILILSNNKIASIDGLGELKDLRELRLDGNRDISDISPAGNLENLRMLTLSDTAVKDISPLYGLKNLTILDLSNTEVSEEQIHQFKSEVPGCEVIQ
jgi:serine/threonine protein kinase